LDSHRITRHHRNLTFPKGDSVLGGGVGMEFLGFQANDVPGHEVGYARIWR